MRNQQLHAALTTLQYLGVIKVCHALGRDPGYIRLLTDHWGFGWVSREGSYNYTRTKHIIPVFTWNTTAQWEQAKKDGMTAPTMCKLKGHFSYPGYLITFQVSRVCEGCLAALAKATRTEMQATPILALCSWQRPRRKDRKC